MALLPIGSVIDFYFEFLNEDDYIDVTGEVVHHGENEDGMGIWFKRIDDRDKEFIRGFVRDYLSICAFYKQGYCVDFGKKGGGGGRCLPPP